MIKGVVIMYKTSLMLVFILIGGFYGCSMNARGKLPVNMKSKTEIYSTHFRMRAKGMKYKQKGMRAYYEEEGPAAFYSDIRYAKTKTRALFRRLPNPDLVLYVFPHVSGKEQTPVPGYTTLFPMYTEIHYAMPGEVPVNTPIKQSANGQRVRIKTGIRNGQNPAGKKEINVIKALFK